MVFDSEKINPDWEEKGKGGASICSNHDLNALVSGKIENRKMKHQCFTVRFHKILMRSTAENNESKDCGCIVQEQPCLFTFCCKGSIWDLSFF